MTSDQALTALLDALEEAGVAYMIVGSWASGVHGEARATHDTDVVVQVAQGQFDRFVRLLRGGGSAEWHERGSSSGPRSTPGEGDRGRKGWLGTQPPSNRTCGFPASPTTVQACPGAPEIAVDSRKADPAPLTLGPSLPLTFDSSPARA